MVFYILKFCRNAWESTKDCICFLQLDQESCIILEKFIMKMLLTAFKSVVAAVTFNKFKYRCKHLNIVSSSVKHPHLPTEIMLFCYQLFSLFIFTFVKCLYIIIFMFLNCGGRLFIYFLIQDTKVASK